MTLQNQLLEILAEPLAARGFELVDVVCAGSASVPSTVTVLVDLLDDREPPSTDDAGLPRLHGSRIDLDGVSKASRIVSDVLDERDPIADAYTLEVSSPGLERPLRTPAHFRRHLGQPVKLKLGAGAAQRRIEGEIESADDDEVVVGGVAIAYGAIERATTVFVWGPAPKPKGPPKRSSTSPAARPDSQAAAQQGAMR